MLRHIFSLGQKVAGTTVDTLNLSISGNLFDSYHRLCLNV